MQTKQLLKNLYESKFFGYDYHDDIKPTLPTQKHTNNTSLSQIANKVADCHLCSLAKSRTNTVFSQGNTNATLMIIGDMPSLLEDESGKIFSGRSGDMLNDMIVKVLGLKRAEVYITNLLKCKPNNHNRASKQECESCIGYLHAEIKLVNPKLIVTLGQIPYRYLCGDMQGELSKIRGSIIDLDGIKLIPTYHPSFLLRNPSFKKDVLVDMKKIKALL